MLAYMRDHDGITALDRHIQNTCESLVRRKFSQRFVRRGVLSFEITNAGRARL